jgi:hypothetical protein
MVLSQLAFAYVPIMNRLFHTAPIDGYYWLPIVAVGLIIYAVMGLEKKYRTWVDGRAA